MSRDSERRLRELMANASKQGSSKDPKRRLRDLMSDGAGKGSRKDPKKGLRDLLADTANKTRTAEEEKSPVAPADAAPSAPLPESVATAVTVPQSASQPGPDPVPEAAPAVDEEPAKAAKPKRRVRRAAVPLPAAEPMPDPLARYPEKRALRIVIPAMLMALALAILVNWRTAPQLTGFTPSPVVTFATKYEPDPLAPSKKPISQLPGQILAYETLARQAVPGAPDRAAEAVYVTLNVNLQMQLAMSVYARVEAFPSAGDAKVKQAQVMTEFPLQSGTTMVGTVVASTGFNVDRSAYGVTWVRGEYVTFVKTTFRDKAPVQQPEKYLRNLSAPVISAIDVYQRTGKEGTQLGAELASGTPKPAESSGGKKRDPNIQSPGGVGGF